MGRNRGKLEIYRDVLQCCSKRKSKSYVKYRCGLNWSQIQEVLRFLLAKKFLETSTEQRLNKNGRMRGMTVYTTTGLGMTLFLAIENVDVILGRNLVNSPDRFLNVANSYIRK